MVLSRKWALSGVMTLVLVVMVTAFFIPRATSPAYAAALTFVHAAGTGDDSTALLQLSDELRVYVNDHCPDGSVSACVDGYTPPEWGPFLNAVFRRAQPDGSHAWDVQLLATYEKGIGFSGVCIYNRVERQPDNTWKVTRWSGWISCSRPDSGLSRLLGVDAPNKAP